MAALELCQHKRPAPTVERFWAANISWQAFFTFVWCKNPGKCKYQVLHRKAGKTVQCLSQIFTGCSANIIILSGH